MSSETERLIELMTEVGQRLGTAFGDMVPDDAQRHLLNAQREMLTALFLIYEHQMGARRSPGRREEADFDTDKEPDAGPRRPRSVPPPRRPRVDHIDLE
jgi:hypothetical protein